MNLQTRKTRLKKRLLKPTRMSNEDKKEEEQLKGNIKSILDGNQHTPN